MTQFLVSFLRNIPKIDGWETKKSEMLDLDNKCRKMLDIADSEGTSCMRSYMPIRGS